MITIRNSDIGFEKNGVIKTQIIDGNIITPSITATTYNNLPHLANTYRVSATGGDWTTLADAITAINAMTGTTGVRLVIDAKTFTITDTITVNSTRPISIEGAYFNTTILNAGTGLTNKPMFNLITPCVFNGISFYGNTLLNYGTLTTENCFNIGTGYYEITDFEIKGFYSGLNLIANSNVFAFNGIISNCTNGIQSNSASATYLDVEVTNIENCTRGIYLLSGATGSEFDILSNFFLNSTSGQTGIVYAPASYLYGDSPTIMNNKWNVVGNFRSGFDFTRTDSRDANINIQNNNNTEDKLAHCKINVVNNASGTTIVNSANPYKLNFVNTSSYTCKFGINGNRITYQPNDVRDVVLWVNGNIQNNQNNRNTDVMVIKNGQTATRISPFTVRIATQNVPYTFGMVVYLEDVKIGDFFELYATSSNNNDVVTLQDLTMFAKAN